MESCASCRLQDSAASCTPHSCFSTKPCPSHLPTGVRPFITLHATLPGPVLLSLAPLDSTTVFSLVPVCSLTSLLSIHRHPPRSSCEAQLDFISGFRTKPSPSAWSLQSLQPHLPTLTPVLPEYLFPRVTLHFHTSAFLSDVPSSRKASRTFQSKLGPLHCVSIISKLVYHISEHTSL